MVNEVERSLAACLWLSVCPEGYESRFARSMYRALVAHVEGRATRVPKDDRKLTEYNTFFSLAGIVGRFYSFSSGLSRSENILSKTSYSNFPAYLELVIHRPSPADCHRAGTQLIAKWIS